jgi:hypothetical protein
VYKDSFKVWDSPHEAEWVGDEGRERVADNIRRAFEFRKVRIELLDSRLSEEENQRVVEAADGSAKMPLLQAPSVGILDVDGLESKRLIALDMMFLKAIFGRVRTVTLAESACDVLFLYATLEADGSVVGSTPGLREIIRDSGAKIVVFGLPNPSLCHAEADKSKPYGKANLVETLDRRVRPIMALNTRGVAAPFGESVGRFTLRLSETAKAERNSRCV